MRRRDFIQTHTHTHTHTHTGLQSFELWPKAFVTTCPNINVTTWHTRTLPPISFIFSLTLKKYDPKFLFGGQNSQTPLPHKKELLLFQHRCVRKYVESSIVEFRWVTGGLGQASHQHIHRRFNGFVQFARKQFQVFQSIHAAKCSKRPRKYGIILNLQLWCVSCLVWQRREMTRECVCETPMDKNGRRKGERVRKVKADEGALWDRLSTGWEK